jgi:dTDP-3-amino-3,4,6-trideoxy-alpha-D-glucose transaminase
MIPANDFRRRWEQTRARCREAFDAVMESGWFILGEEVRAFETSLAALWGRRYACGVGSGLDALQISLQLLGLRPGDRVLTTPLSAFATTLAVIKLGGVPVFVDTDRYGLLDLEACRRALEARPAIRFLVPVHLYGHAMNMAELERLKDDFGLRLVEDCAQSVGAAWSGRATGSAGQLAATSFYPTKNLGAAGDGGAILTDDPELDGAARSLRDYGQTEKYHHALAGYNSRLDELQAALLRRVFLPELAAWTARRREIATRYLDEIRNPLLTCLGCPPECESCWHLFPVLAPSEHKAAFLTYLRGAGVTPGEHYPLLIPGQEALSGSHAEVIGECREASRIARGEVSLPIHPFLSDAEVTQVIEVANAWNGR